MEFLAYIATAILALAIGSFLNVLIYRFPKEESWLAKIRSYCPWCKKVLKTVELIPIVSYLIQKGQCRSCRKKISWQYLLVELGTMIIFILAFNRYYSDLILTSHEIIGLFRDFLFISVLIVTFVIDIKHYLIIPKLIYFTIPIAFVLNWWISDWSAIAFGDMVFSGIVGFLFYWLQHFVSKGKWVGDGDMKLGLLLGVMLGLQWLLFCILIAYVVGAIVAIILLVSKKIDRKGQLPMAAFLAPAAVIMILYGDLILNWYLNIIL